MYYDEKCLFLNPGPKIALALVFIGLKKTIKDRGMGDIDIYKFFNQEVSLILESHIGEI